MVSTDTKDVLVKLQKANEIMENLIELTLADEKITDDEQNLLYSINNNLQEYVKLTISSVSDNVVTETEKLKLRAIEIKIISDAQLIARKDNNVTPEEKVLLDTLIDSIRELAK